METIELHIVKILLDPKHHDTDLALTLTCFYVSGDDMETMNKCVPRKDAEKAIIGTYFFGESYYDAVGAECKRAFEEVRLVPNAEKIVINETKGESWKIGDILERLAVNGVKNAAEYTKITPPKVLFRQIREIVPVEIERR